MANSWRPSRSEKARYFIVASFMLIVQVIGLLFLGLWLGQQVSFLMGVLGAVIGGMVGLASGTFILYRMALSWEKKALEKLGNQRCPNCKQSFELNTPKCPYCGYKAAPMTQSPSRSD